MADVATLGKEEAESKAGAEKRPLWWGLAAALVILSAAVAYKIVKSDGNVDFQGGLDGVQVKISQAQKTIASAREEVAEAQKQLNEREARLDAQQQALQEREAKVQELLASLDKNEAAATKLTPQQAQSELKKLRAARTPVSAAAPEVGMKSSLDKLSELRDSLDRTNLELQTAAKPVIAPR